MLRVLSLETSTDRGGFALWSGDATTDILQTSMCQVVWCPPGQPHAETLMPALRDALAALGWARSSIDVIAFDAGPGMFTGLRVAAALAQGLAFALDRPVVPVSSLQVLAESAYAAVGASRILTLLDARMNQIYAGCWVRTMQGWTAEVPPCLVNPLELDCLGICPDASLQVAGTALDVYPDVAHWLAQRRLVDSQTRYPLPDALARLGAQAYVSGMGVDASQALPVYVRDRVALTTAERAAGLSL
jgi:tRNA threonylcarbamoyladenosine biosynthesis protein TsaB